MTTTLDKLDTINDSLNDIKTAVIAKGQTPTGDITTYATAISNIAQQAAVIDSLSITPSTSSQTITAPSGTDGYSPISVAAVTSSIDSNIQAANIVSGVSILGVNGSATVLNGDTLSVTPSTSVQTLTPTSPKNGFTQVNVSAVTSNIDANITAENIKKDVTILGVTGSLESGGGGSYQLHRVKDDNNNEIGTAFMEFEDANGNKFDVVCLDALYRGLDKKVNSSSGSIPNLPTYNNGTNLWWYDCAKETATFNTTKILAAFSSSPACTFCRSQSFVINGTRYYGQLPNIREVFEMYKNRTVLDEMDITPWPESGTPIVRFASSTSTLASTQMLTSSGYVSKVGSGGEIVYVSLTTASNRIIPVLEIPK